MERLKELRTSKGMFQKDVAAKIGVDRTTYLKYENGTTEPSFDILQQLADIFEVSVDYLLGRDFPSSPPASTGGKWIPVLGRVAAGIPVEMVEEVIDWKEITMDTAKSGEFFALRINGSSMEPRCFDGDVVIVRKQDDVESGDVAVVAVNGEDATIKRIKKRPEGLMLIPNNPAFEPMFYSCDDVQRLPVRILGKVVEVRGKM